MAEPGDEVAAGADGCGRLRASHADREQVVGTLKAAFVQGMLAKDEFDLRVGQAFGSRTYAELAALTADLPAGLIAARPSGPARAQGERRVLRPGRWISVATVLYAGAWVYVLFLSPHAGDDVWTAPLIAGGFLIYLGVWICALGEMLVSRREKRSGGQRPRRLAPGAGGQASRRPPSAGPGRQLPPIDPGQRHTAEAQRRRTLRPDLRVRGHCAGGALAAGTAPASG
jgi:DUF1707 SHOCT-like domain